MRLADEPLPRFYQGKIKIRMKDPKLPVQTIEVFYKSEHSPKGIHRTIFVYEGEDVNLYLSKAWKPSAMSAKINNVTAKLVTELKPHKINGEWIAQ